MIVTPQPELEPRFVVLDDLNAHVKEGEQLGATMGHYTDACICLNGHIISGDARSLEATSRCGDCGDATISRCLSCDTAIRGSLQNDMGFMPPKPKLKSYCSSCGAPYPWTERKTAGVMELADAVDELTANERDSLRELLPHLIEETPRTPAAGFKVLAIVQRAGPAARALLKDAVVSIAVDAGKKAMGM